MKYAYAAALYSKKRGKYRSLGNYNYMHSDCVDGQIVYTCHNGKPDGRWGRTFMTIYPDDTIELHWHNNGQGMNNDLHRYTNMHLRRVGSKTKSHNYMLVLPDRSTTPMFDGVKVRGNEVLNPQPMQERVVNTSTAKKVRDKITEWKKVFDVVYLLHRPDIESNRHWQGRLPRDFVWPAFDTPVDANMALALLKDAYSRTERLEYVKTDEVETVSWGGQPHVQPKWVKIEKPNYYKNLLKNATERLRGKWYEEVGAYEWKDAA